jgi:hypothetical protein
MLQGGSPAVDRGRATGTMTLPVPAIDFFGAPRDDGAADSGAAEHH